MSASNPSFGNPLPAPREGLVKPQAHRPRHGSRSTAGRSRSTGRRWSTSASPPLLVALALVGFRTAFFGGGWILAAVGGLLLGLAVAHLVAAFRLPAVVALLGVGRHVLRVRRPLAVRQDLIAGSDPLGGRPSATSPAPRSTAGSGCSPCCRPVDAVGELVALPFLVGLVGGRATYLVARRTRAPYAVVLAPLALLALTIALGTLEPAALVAQGAVFGLLAIGWMVLRGRAHAGTPAERRRAARARAGIAAGLLVMAGRGRTRRGSAPARGRRHLRQVARTSVVPPVRRRRSSPARSPATASTPSPTTPRSSTASCSRSRVRRPAPRCGSPRSTPTAGSVWGASNRAQTGTAEPGAAFQQVGERVAARGEGSPATLQISVPEGGYTDVWLPTVGEVTGVKFNGLRKDQLASRLWLNTETSSAIVPDRLTPGDSYRMDVLLPAKPPTELPKSLLTSSGSLTEGQELSFLDAKIDAWTRDAQDPWSELTSVARVMRNDGAYTNGGSKNSQESYYLAGHSQGRLARFVGATQLAGDDEQYASTLALIGNRFDIPTRVVMGALLRRRRGGQGPRRPRLGRGPRS